jgi:hypothetical protein
MADYYADSSVLVKRHVVETGSRWVQSLFDDDGSSGHGTNPPVQDKLRGYDAVHLACALFMRDTLRHQDLPSPIVLSADQELSIAAQAKGLDVDDPNAHS